MWHSDMEVIGTGSKAFHDKMQEPRETDTYRTADTAERDALTQQMFNQSALLVRNATVFGRGHKLALARFALMILFAVASMAIFLVPVRATRWARVSHNHS